MSATESLDAFTQANVNIAFWEAEKIRALARFAEHRRPDDPRRALAKGTMQELAARLGVAPATAAKQLSVARNLVDRLPATLAALGNGVIDYSRARALAEITASMSAHDTHLVETHILAGGARPNYTSFRQAVRRYAAGIDPVTAEKRRQTAVEKRDITVRAKEDGTALLIGHFTAQEADDIYDRVDRLAGQDKVPGQTRAQCRADVLRDLVLDTADEHASRRPTVWIHRVVLCYAFPRVHSRLGVIHPPTGRVA